MSENIYQTTRHLKFRLYIYIPELPEGAIFVLWMLLVFIFIVLPLCLNFWKLWITNKSQAIL